MVKLTSPKRNILEHLRGKNLPSYARNNERAKKPLNKGLYLGSCNRIACLKPGANWYNHSTQEYYCEACAHWLNDDVFNKKDAMRIWGHDLCTYGKYDHEKYSQLHYFHRTFEKALSVFKYEDGLKYDISEFTIELEDIEAKLHYRINKQTNTTTYSNTHIAKKELSFVYEFSNESLKHLKERAYSSYKSLQRLFESVKETAS